MRQSLVRRYGAVLSAMTAFVGCCVLLVNLYYLERYSVEFINTGQQQLHTVVEQQLLRDAERAASTLTGNLSTAIYNRDSSAIQKLLETLLNQGNIHYLYLYDTNGLIIHDGSGNIPAQGQHVRHYLPEGVAVSFKADQQKIGPYIHITQPVIVGESTLAVLRMAIAYGSAEHDILQFSTDLAAQGFDLRREVIMTSLTLIAIFLLAAAFVVFLLSQHLLSPINQLVERCRRYAAGEKNTLFYLDRQDELGLLSEALEEMKEAIERSQSQVEKLAYLDPLTQLPNRRMFNEELESLITWAGRHNHAFALFFIDLDHFKQVNDIAGHDIGDKLLRQTAARLEKLLATLAERLDFPVPERLLLSRLGGDEFVMILPAYPHISDVEDIARQAAQVLDAAFIIDGHRFTLSASIGITLFPQYGNNLTELMKQADTAMYAAKQSDHKRYRFYVPEMNTALVSNLLIEQGIREAMEDKTLFLDYQPICCLKSGNIIGAEALLRWKHPTQGLISPASFIPVIEKTNIILPLTLWLLKQACQDLERHILPRRSRFKLSVNISGAVMQNPSVRCELRRIISQFALPAKALHLEITETTMMEELQHCSETLKEWKETGAAIWVDDFGTGYSSLSYLHRLPIDGLKIDQSFVKDIHPEQPSQVIETILALAASLNLEVVSEGIENELQQERLTTLGSHYGQGFLLAHPAPVENLIHQLDREPEKNTQ
ncbi:MAG: EAL domain-containing protein [Pontibacterium sp.]